MPNSRRLLPSRCCDSPTLAAVMKCKVVWHRINDRYMISYPRIFVYCSDCEGVWLCNVVMDLHRRTEFCLLDAIEVCWVDAKQYRCRVTDQTLARKSEFMWWYAQEIKARRVNSHLKQFKVLVWTNGKKGRFFIRVSSFEFSPFYLFMRINIPRSWFFLHLNLQSRQKDPWKWCFDKFLRVCSRGTTRLFTVRHCIDCPPNPTYCTWMDSSTTNVVADMLLGWS